ncbi:MAG: hypothetical protein WA182_12240 [Candidatus Sulfotelmatobacter sp.]
MPSKCQVCVSPFLSQISDLLDQNTLTLKQISEQFNISVHSLSRHCARHRNEAPESPAETANDISLWIQRCDDQYRAAVFDSDSRSAIQALGQGLRAVEARQKQLEREREVTDEEGESDGRISVSSLDQMMELFDQVPVTRTDAAKLEEALRRARALNRVDGMQIFHRMIENNEFAEDLVTYATSWTPTKKGITNESVQSEAIAPN